MKKADASGAEFVVFATEEELARGEVAVKALREHPGDVAYFTEQTTVSIDDLPLSLSTAMNVLK